MYSTTVAVLNYLFAVTMTFTHIGGYVTCGLFFLFFWKGRKEALREPLALAVMAFLLYGLLRSAFVPDAQWSLRVIGSYAAHWLLPFLLGYSVREAAAARRYYWTYAGVLAVIIAFSMLAYFGLFPVQFGKEYFLVHDGLLKALRSHIALGAMCLMLTAVTVSLAGAERERRLRAGLVGFSVFLAAALFLTGSRGYYIAAFLTFALFSIYWIVRTKNWKLFLLSTGGIAVVISALLLASPGLRERISTTGPRTDNVRERLALYHVAYWEVQDRPVFGFGPGQAIRQKQYAERLPEDMRDVMRHPRIHAFHLNFVADYGIAGYALFAALVLVVLRRLWRIGAEGEGFVRAMGFGMFWGFIGLLIGDCFDTLLVGPGTAMETFWFLGLLFGCSPAPSVLRKQEASNETAR